MSAEPAVSTTAAAAALDRARTAHLASEWEHALPAAEALERIARADGNLEMLGRALHIKGTALLNLERGNPGPMLAEALELLEGEDAGRVTECCRVELGNYHLERGDLAEAESLYEQARRRIFDLGHVGSSLLYDATRAITIYGRGEYERALQAADEVAGFANGYDGDDGPRAFAYALRVRTLALLALGRLETAKIAATTYLWSSGTDDVWDHLCGPLLAARAHGETGRFPALVALADRASDPQLPLLARLWWFAALRETNPIEAALRAEELYEPAALSTRAVVRFEVRAVHKAGGDRLLDLDRAHKALDAAVYEVAYRLEHGNATKMATRLGRTQQAVSQKMCGLGLKRLPGGRPRKA